MKNICILGLGSIAQRVAKGIQYAKNARLYAVCSRSQNKAGAFAKQFSIPCFFDSMEIMLEDKNVDVVYICTPNTLHKEHILSCLSYGCLLYTSCSFSDSIGNCNVFILVDWGKIFFVFCVTGSFYDTKRIV